MTQAMSKKGEILIIFLSMVLLMNLGGSSTVLSEDFYSQSCPEMESIVKQVMVDKSKAGQNITAPSTLRLFFHDCFVQGCDGSVLLVSTAENKAERDAPINLLLAGDAFDAVIRAKAALEKECPGVVSCADILAVLARDATVLLGGPTWAVKNGRRDSRISTSSRATADLRVSSANYSDPSASSAPATSPTSISSPSPAPTPSAAPTAQSSSPAFTPPDPSIDPNFRTRLLSSCPINKFDPEVVVFLDEDTPQGFDNGFYKALMGKRGLLASDQALGDGMAAAVALYAANQTVFFENFAAAMVRFGEVGVLSGEEGEIRKDCLKIN